MGNEQRMIDGEKLKRILRNAVGHLKAFGLLKEADVVESIIKVVNAELKRNSTDAAHG